MKFLTALLLLIVAIIVTVDAYPKHKNHGQVTGGVNKEGGKTTWHVEGEKQVWGNKHGSVNVNGGVVKPPGGKPQGHVGVSGTIHWR